MRSTTIAVFPGTFDPLTLGHFDIICRAAKIFDRLIIAVAKNPSKNSLLSLEDRSLMIKDATKDLKNVEVKGFSNLISDFLQQQEANILVRGVRTVADYDYETQLTGMYKTMMPDLEIVMLPTAGHLSYISSTLVREVLIHKGDISKFVPKAVSSYIEKLNQEKIQ